MTSAPDQDIHGLQKFPGKELERVMGIDKLDRIKFRQLQLPAGRGPRMVRVSPQSIAINPLNQLRTLAVDPLAREARVITRDDKTAGLPFCAASLPAGRGTRMCRVQSRPTAATPCASFLRHAR